jgi:hypothetical protein
VDGSEVKRVREALGQARHPAGTASRSHYPAPPGPAGPQWSYPVSKFIIQPHGRLQEWIADEKGYFRDEGLDYEFQAGWAAQSRKTIDSSGGINEMRAGAFEAYKHGGGNKGVKSDISCACHWAIGQASAQQIGVMWRDSYVVTPGGIMVPPESDIHRPENLAGREIAVGYHSGSHFTSIQSLEPFLSRDRINLKFVGSIWARVDAAVDPMFRRRVSGD